jgi:hypothetical protein
LQISTVIYRYLPLFAVTRSDFRQSKNWVGFTLTSALGLFLPKAWSLPHFAAYVKEPGWPESGHRPHFQLLRFRFTDFPISAFHNQQFL